MRWLNFPCRSNLRIHGRYLCYGRIFTLSPSCFHDLPGETTLIFQITKIQVYAPAVHRNQKSSNTKWLDSTAPVRWLQDLCWPWSKCDNPQGYARLVFISLICKTWLVAHIPVENVFKFSWSNLRFLRFIEVPVDIPVPL